MNGDLTSLIEAHLADPAVTWSLGSFGAIAEFMWQADEPKTPATGRPLSLVTSRGAIFIDGTGEAEAVAYTTRSRYVERRHSGVALCLPLARCAMAGRNVVTELGPDADALRDQDRGAILFDMGLGQLQVDVLVRSREPKTIAILRAASGRSLFDPSQTLMMDLPRLSPHRVFAGRCGRIEVYQSIPSAGGRSPDGPHTHVLPKLLKAGRTHAANIAIPHGLVPCLSLHFARPAPDRALHIQEDDDQ